MLALRKPNKDDYTVLKSYRLIALLNIIKKLLELVIAYRLMDLAETNNLLLETQIEARKGRSVEITLQLITEQVHIIWNLLGTKQIATLLSLDIAGAFDHSSHKRLIHNLRRRRIPLILINQIVSFLKNQEIIIKLFERESQPYKVVIGIL